MLCLSQAPPAQAQPWQTIIYQDQTPSQLRALKQIGITAGRVQADRANPDANIADAIKPFQDAGLSWYVENIATDFYSAYHRWRPHRPVNADFVAAHALHARNAKD